MMTPTVPTMPIFKSPATDSGFKKSALGLLDVDWVNGELTLYQDTSKETFNDNLGMMQIVYEDGDVLSGTTLEMIRKRLHG